LPLASARPSPLAAERTVTDPPVLEIVSPSAIRDRDVLPAMLTAMAAATPTGPLVPSSFAVLACSPF
jgi:hypothetical protein